MSDTLLAELAKVRDEIKGSRDVTARLEQYRDRLMQDAVNQDVPSQQVALAAGVAPARVSQVAPRKKDTGTPVERESAGEKSPAGSGVSALVGAALVSGHASTYAAKPYGWRRTAWADVSRLGTAVLLPETGAPRHLNDNSLSRVLMMAREEEVTRVFLVGQPATMPGEEGDAAIRAWFLDEPGPNWEVAPMGHHLADAKSPTARYQHADGTTIEIMRSAAWWGESDASVFVCRDAWFTLQEAVRLQFGDTARLLATPAVTARDLWTRTIGHRTSYPVLSDEVRELIQSTAGQGRIELLPPNNTATGEPGVVGPIQTIPGVHVRDGRLMYAALTWGMPVGEPTIWAGSNLERATDAELDRLIMGRSRWHVTATVPLSWDRPFGLLMAPRQGGGWMYPRQPGEHFETWADGSEVALARSYGWEVRVFEGLTWKEGKPLNSWTEKLLAIWSGTDDVLVKRAVRSLILFGIGAFASRGRTTTHTVPEDQADKVPAGVQARRSGGMLVWTQEAPATAWARDLAHPEWSAAIWARARVRLLDGPGLPGAGRTGALHLPSGVDVIAFRTDALVLTGDPGWADDGKPGRLRYDGEIEGPFNWPETEHDMLRMKTAAQLNKGK